MADTFDFSQAMADMDGGVLLAKLSRAVQETLRDRLQVVRVYVGTVERGCP